MPESPQRSNRLFDLLPTVYHDREGHEGEALEALLSIVETQSDRLHADVARLWRNLFIETCDPWVIPYIGDLVGNNLLYDEERVGTDALARELFPDLTGPGLRPELALRTRADVAKTIYYRRRKGTLPMLEELARDVTGWAAHAVEFFRLLGWSQHMNHRRPEALDCMHLRDVERVDRRGRPFDVWSHTVDVRAPGQRQGWYNIPHIGFFLWRLRSFGITDVTARQRPESPTWAYHCNPLGADAPLFNAWLREGDEAGLAGEMHVPGPIRPAYFHRVLDEHRLAGKTRPDSPTLYGPLDPSGSLQVWRNGTAVPVCVDPDASVDTYEPHIVCRRLRPWPVLPPAGAVIAVDVETGRLAVGDGWKKATTSVHVDCHYGFAANLGGGPYERRAWLIEPRSDQWRRTVHSTGSGDFTDVESALLAWAGATPPRPNAVIQILDNATYTLPPSIELADDHWLAIEAANEARPHLRVASDPYLLTLAGNHPGAGLTLSGLLVEGAVAVDGELESLRLLHTTLVPGRTLNEDGTPDSTAPSILVAEASANAGFRLQVAFSIVGPVRVPRDAEGIWVLDSIVDGLDGEAIAGGDGAGPAAAGVLERATLFGPSRFRRLEASEVLFTGPVEAEQRHEGCVRFSYLPQGSITPRRYRCQPDLAERAAVEAARADGRRTGTEPTNAELAALRTRVRAGLVPGFTVRRYGQPGYAQLRDGVAGALHTGAEDGSEMGAFCHLKQPQRETNLRIRLEEYLPFGLVPAFIHVT